jgi:hypothetical protein
MEPLWSPTVRHVAVRARLADGRQLFLRADPTA